MVRLRKKFDALKKQVVETITINNLKSFNVHTIMKLMYDKNLLTASSWQSKYVKVSQVLREMELEKLVSSEIDEKHEGAGMKPRIFKVKEIIKSDI